MAERRDRPFVAADFAWPLGDELAGDRAVTSTGTLAGRHVTLVVCGGIAAYRSPDVVRALRREGATVRVMCTPAALAFVSRVALEWAAAAPPIVELDGAAAHVADAHVDLWLVAPATASTLNKLAVGIADNAATTALSSAVGRMERGQTRIVVVPTMHGTMLNSITRQSLATLANLGVEVLRPRLADGKALLPETADLVQAVVDLLATP